MHSENYFDTMIEDIRISPIELSDVENIKKLGDTALEFHVDSEDEEPSKLFWEEEQLRTWVSMKQDVLLKAENREDRKILGFILTQIHYPTRKAVIENIFVLQELHGHGIGKQLLSLCVQELFNRGIKNVVAYSIATNDISEKLFIKNGFQKGKQCNWLSLYL